MLLLLQGWGAAVVSEEGDVSLADSTPYLATIADSTIYAAAVADSTIYSVSIMDMEST